LSKELQWIKKNTPPGRNQGEQLKTLAEFYGQVLEPGFIGLFFKRIDY
jgi:hypothetical protein